MKKRKAEQPLVMMMKEAMPRVTVVVTTTVVTVDIVMMTATMIVRVTIVKTMIANKMAMIGVNPQ